ncbi:unnamed protein product [Symbiodinium natans]|uniref:Uncharacterized protein n=1 Tax=Symbiodinium natans TaxID=878477 RepID=A0A812QB61_9DINO|nr:unnamed protein product [Symbiodinium natans]
MYSPSFPSRSATTALSQHPRENLSGKTPQKELFPHLQLPPTLLLLLVERCHHRNSPLGRLPPQRFVTLEATTARPDIQPSSAVVTVRKRVVPVPVFLVERVRADARERREQLREAQKLQAEQEHLMRLQRRALDREAQKQLLEAERFEKWREKLEHRDMARAKLWEKYPKVAESTRSPRSSLVSVSPSPSARSHSPRSHLKVPFSPGLSPSSSAAALLSPRQRLKSWDMNIATYTREEVHELEKERRADLADKEVRVLRDRETRSKERSRQEVSYEKLHLRRTAELEEIRLAREAKKQQEIQKRKRDREQKQEVRAMHRAGEVGSKEYEERLKEVQAHRLREKKVYEKQQCEEEAERKRMLQAGEKELQIQEARYRQERVRELQRQKLVLEQGVKEREAEAVRDARESAKEELRRRRILDLEQKRAKVLAVKADQEDRKKRREEEKCYIYTPAPRLSDKVKAFNLPVMTRGAPQVEGFLVAQ